MRRRSSSSACPNLDDDCIESVLLAAVIGDVGRLMQVSRAWARAASGDAFKARWALRIRVLQYAKNLRQPQLVKMQERDPDDSYDPGGGIAGVVSHGRMLTCSCDSQQRAWLTSWKLVFGMPELHRRIPLPEGCCAGVAQSESGEYAVVTSYEGGGRIYSASDDSLRALQISSDVDEEVQTTAVVVLGERVYTANWGGQVFVHLLATGELCGSCDMAQFTGMISRLATDGKSTLYVASQRGIAVMHTSTAQLVGAPRDGEAKPTLCPRGACAGREEHAAALSPSAVMIPEVPWRSRVHSVQVHGGRLFAAVRHYGPANPGCTSLMCWSLEPKPEYPAHLFTVRLRHPDQFELALLQELCFVGGGICVNSPNKTWTPRDNTVEVFDLRALDEDGTPQRLGELPAPPHVNMMCATAAHLVTSCTMGEKRLRSKLRVY